MSGRVSSQTSAIFRLKAPIQNPMFVFAEASGSETAPGGVPSQAMYSL